MTNIILKVVFIAYLCIIVSFLIVTILMALDIGVFGNIDRWFSYVQIAVVISLFVFGFTYGNLRKKYEENKNKKLNEWFVI